MKCRSLVAATLLLSCSSALASTDQQIASVQVRPDTSPILAFACASPDAPRHSDVERLLRINDRSQTAGLSNRLVGAVVEACNAGVAHIVIQRSASGGSLTWSPAARDAVASIALN